MTNNIDYKMLKKQNLAQLVHEYETESNEIARKAQAKRNADIRLLEAHAQVQSLDFQSNSRKSRPEIVTSHDLKMYVHSFNN